MARFQISTVHPHALPVPVELRRLYVLTSLVWMTYATALSFTAYGSALLRFAEPGRLVLTALAAIVAIAMAVRALVPGRPEWTRWTLPLIGGTSVSTFCLTLFAVNYDSIGYTPARVGYALLILVPALFAFAHYSGEKVVAPR
jgi:hypothetical protein